MSWLASIFSRLASRLPEKIALLGGILLALLGVYAGIRRAGRDAERADQFGKSLDTLQEMQDANSKGPHSAGDVDDRLQRHTF